jgi:hypothetical protein
MTTQYNVPVKVLDPKVESMVQHALKPYRVFTDASGNLCDTCFSRENAGPYVGDVIVVKTLRKEAAETARNVLSGIEGLLVLPISECSWEEDKARVAQARQKISA